VHFTFRERYVQKHENETIQLIPSIVRRFCRCGAVIVDDRGKRFSFRTATSFLNEVVCASSCRIYVSAFAKISDLFGGCCSPVLPAFPRVLLLLHVAAEEFVGRALLRAMNLLFMFIRYRFSMMLWASFFFLDLWRCASFESAGEDMVVGCFRC
jgi:hypothetical protein